MKDTAAWSEYCKSLAPALIHACTMAPVSTGPSALVRELANTAPDWPFRHAACRGGWHRLGGLIGCTEGNQTGTGAGNRHRFCPGSARGLHGLLRARN